MPSTPTLDANLRAFLEGMRAAAGYPVRGVQVRGLS